jgi:hypothetical protein
MHGMKFWTDKKAIRILRYSAIVRHVVGVSPFQYGDNHDSYDLEIEDNSEELPRQETWSSEVECLNNEIT